MVTVLSRCYLFDPDKKYPRDTCAQSAATGGNWSSRDACGLLWNTQNARNAHQEAKSSIQEHLFGTSCIGSLVHSVLHVPLVHSVRFIRGVQHVGYQLHAVALVADLAGRRRHVQLRACAAAGSCVPSRTSAHLVGHRHRRHPGRRHVDNYSVQVVCQLPFASSGPKYSCIALS